MAFKLPTLKTDVDCEPIGYPGLIFKFWLNPTRPKEEWEPPENPQPWQRSWYEAYARVCLKITIPAELTDSGEEEVTENVTAKTIYDMEQAVDFEAAVMNWAFGVWDRERTERLQVELKN